jgi:hypothetical protein
VTTGEAMLDVAVIVRVSGELEPAALDAVMLNE